MTWLTDHPDFKPMLASDAGDEITLPCMASPKLDGIRCIVIDGVAYSRSLKPIPNLYVQKVLGGASGAYDGLDGELIVGPPNAHDAYNKTSSGVMSIKGEPDFTFWVFDNIYMDKATPYSTRYSTLYGIVSLPFTKTVEHTLIGNTTALERYEQQQVDAGYEGIMVRSINGPYKYGRSSTKQGILLKVKRFSDSEAEIIGVQELLSNQNVAFKDELGSTARSTHKENMKAMNTLGALLVRDVKTGIPFSIGTGFTAEKRSELWEQRNSGLIGKIAKYKSFLVGVKDAPRFPVFLGFRDKIDMGSPS